MLDQPRSGCWLRCTSEGQSLWSQGPDAESRTAVGPFSAPQTVPAILWLVAAGVPLLQKGTWLACSQPGFLHSWMSLGIAGPGSGAHAIQCLGGADTSGLLSERPPLHLLERRFLQVRSSSRPLYGQSGGGCSVAQARALLPRARSEVLLVVTCQGLRAFPARWGEESRLTDPRRGADCLPVRST